MNHLSIFPQSDFATCENDNLVAAAHLGEISVKSLARAARELGEPHVLVEVGDITITIHTGLTPQAEQAPPEPDPAPEPETAPASAEALERELRRANPAIFHDCTD